MDEIERFRKEARFRNLSPRTIQSYEICLRKFFEYVDKDYRKVTKKDVREFLEGLQARKVSGSTIHLNLNAIKFFFEQVMHRNFKIDIRYSKRPTRLPEFLTKEESKRLIGKITNWKHRLMIEVLYGGGLRVSELLNLKIKDLALEKGYGFVRQGKGRKDRIFLISKICVDKINNLIDIEKLSYEDYLFQTNRNGKYNVRSVQEIVKRATLLAGIKKEIHPHTLRHSFATHLIQNGSSLNEVQSLLGHKSPETSMIYVHMASPSMINIKSPLDTL